MPRLCRSQAASVGGGRGTGPPRRCASRRADSAVDGEAFALRRCRAVEAERAAATLAEPQAAQVVVDDEGPAGTPGGTAAAERWRRWTPRPGRAAG
mmetsp:Transcript_22175/g.50833  ORF Transcript_22175/g.50833 Transcript_22175/m.50833 type:complete len:96 (-) Transcript_22175:493-780(-)